MNPQHTIPTLEDDGFHLWESCAISCYLADKFCKEDDDSLYPKCPMARAWVHQRMYFNQELWTKFFRCFAPVIFKGATEIPEDDKNNLHKCLEILDGFISKCGGYVAGDHITIADHCIVATVSSMAEAGVDLSKYSNIEE